MKTQALLSAMGRDRVGVAGDIAEALKARRVDIEDSRWSAFRGRFALIAQVCAEPQDVACLTRELDRLARDLGFDLRLEPLRDPPAPARGKQLVVESFSSGPAGMSAVTALLKRHEINIENLETESSSNPWRTEFHMQARVTAPASCSLAGLEEELRRLGRERRMDIVVRPISSAACERQPTPIKV